MKCTIAELAVFLMATVATVESRDACYAIGADISWNRAAVASGQNFTDDGTQKPLLDILKEHGFNWIRLRLFVDPTAVVPETDESPYSRSGECDLPHTIEFAKYIKEAGFKFLLDFHYSDIWADPGKQYKPMSWRDLSYPQLVEKVRSYTRESLEAFEEEGVLPEMVQVGNEIVNGMIWPDGRDDNMSQFAELINAGIDGVKDVSDDIKVLIHNISSHEPNKWLNDLNRAGVTRIDVYGLSYYSEWHGTASDLRRRANEVAANHDVKIAIAEYAENHREVNDIIFNLPDEKGFGTFNWEPTRSGYWTDEPLFNRSTVINERMDLYPDMVEAYETDDCEVVVHTSFSVVPDDAVTTPSKVWWDANGTLNLTGHLSTSSDLEVFTLQGKLVGRANPNRAASATSSYPLKNGTYIIRANGSTSRPALNVTGMNR